MFYGSDFVVIAMAMLALVFFMWYAVAGITKGRGRPDGQQPDGRANMGKREP